MRSVLSAASAAAGATAAGSAGAAVVVDMRFSDLTQQRINAIKDEYKEILEQISQLSQELSEKL